MGIRFFCPNGHKLNVKEHLAGKAGFCPECGARLIIPLQSTRKSSKELAEEAAASGNTTNFHNLHKQPEPQKETPQVAPQVSALSPNDTAAQSEPEPVVTTEKNSSDTINPILQDQSVVWYIQVPGGPQYGPATGDVVHSWIKEHRISATMLLWREGWENWLEAKNVFPELDNL